MQEKVQTDKKNADQYLWRKMFKLGKKVLFTMYVGKLQTGKKSASHYVCRKTLD